MKQMKICFAAIMVVAIGAMGYAFAQEEKQAPEKKKAQEEQEQKKPRLTITEAPEGVKVKVIQAERSEPPAPEPPAREMTAEEQAWYKAGLPGAPHELLKQMVGRWEVKLRFWPAPGAEPQEGRGSALKESVLGGRYLQTTYKGEWMGESFIGMGFEGYDNTKEKYTNLWLDNTSTVVYTTEGTVDETGKVWTYFGEYVDPVTKKVNKTKNIATIRSLSMHTYESFDQNEEGEWVKTMEAVYGSVGMR